MTTPRVGICGDRVPDLFAAKSGGLVCELPHGHAGWHEASTPMRGMPPLKTHWGVTAEEWLPADDQVSVEPISHDGYQYAVEDPPGIYHAYGDQSWVQYGHVLRYSHPDGRIVRRRIRAQVGQWEVTE